jgi:hypothetical protein
VQRELEAWGISTISISNNPAATRRLSPPRWVRVRFPRGSTVGGPGNRATQLAVLRDTLAALAEIEVPGGSRELPYRWEDPPLMWRGRALSEGSYS